MMFLTCLFLLSSIAVSLATETTLQAVKQVELVSVRIDSKNNF